MNKVLITASGDPYHNQALEACLLETVKEDVILYLWQNQKTVFIGKNQNAFAECDVSLLESEGGRLARRTSGGGAVYHDFGNLNFTFFTGRNDQDIQKEDEVILRALSSLGIKAERNGRNDLLINGRKFSGHAYYRGKENAYHHGTLMVDVLAEDVSRYLRPSKQKLQKKGVSSVRSRIINLKEVKEDLTVDKLKKALITSFEEAYGKAECLREEDLDPKQIREWEDFFSSPEHLYGEEKKREYYRETLTEKGLVRMEYDREEGKIQDPLFYTDSLDDKWAQELPDNEEVWERLMREEEKCMM